MKNFRIGITLAALAAVSVLASGCSILNAANNNTALAVNTGIELVTSVYIQHKGGGTAAGDLAAAQQVKAVALELQGVATGTLTVAQFNAQMQTYIAKLSPPQQILASALLAQIDLYFQQQVATGSILTAQTAAAANIVLGDVIAACAVYGA